MGVIRFQGQLMSAFHQRNTRKTQATTVTVSLSLSLLLLSQTGPTTFTFWSQHLETKESEKWEEGGQGKSNAKYEQLVQQAAKYLLPVFTCDIVT